MVIILTILTKLQHFKYYNFTYTIIKLATLQYNSFTLNKVVSNRVMTAFARCYTFAYHKRRHKTYSKVHVLAEKLVTTFCWILSLSLYDEALQGVKATSDTTLKTRDTGISNQRQANRMRR